jgi:L-ascorbate metabolism protein UlaG (beta-lactamase superfamily)
MEKNMKIQLIRNATMKITYAGRTILTDPMLSPKDEFDPFAGIARNPTIELPLQIEDIVRGVESVIVTHYHPDHFDMAASLALPKETPIFCQSGDESRMIEEGFKNILPLETSNAHAWEGITITCTGGKHGKGKILERMGKVSGFVLQADGEPTVYWVGDSIWCEEVENVIKMFTPEVIITHSGGAAIPGYGAIIMDGEQTITTVNSNPDAIIVAIHMESLDHCTVSRKMLRQMADSVAIPSSRLMIPEDGETISF